MDGAVSKSFWAPPSFAERGASVPFTTPIIVGARVRGRGESLELVVPNPSGAKGNYILQWKNLPDVFTLTVHDRVLHRAVGLRDLRARARAPDERLDEPRELRCDFVGATTTIRG